MSPRSARHAAHPAMKTACLLVACCALLRADADELLRRAETRLRHGNELGALALLEQAVGEDPNHGPSLARLMSVDTPRRARHALAYLRRGQPLTAHSCREALACLSGSAPETPFDVRALLERAALLPLVDDHQAFGPWRAWDLPARAASPLLPAGPLRCESEEAPLEAHRRVLGEVAERLKQGKVIDCIVWSRMALLYEEAGDRSAALAALERAQPDTLDERIDAGLVRVLVTTDASAWWRDEGASLLDQAVQERRSAVSGVLDSLVAVARRRLVEARDLESLVDLVARDSRLRPVGTRHRALQWAVREIDKVLLLDEALQRLDKGPEPGLGLLRVYLLLEMYQEDLALEELERLAGRHSDDPTVLETASLYWKEAEIVSRQVDAGERLLEIAGQGGLDIDAEFAGELVDAIRLARGPAVAEALSVRLLRCARSPDLAASLVDAWAGDRPSQDLADAAMEAVERLGFSGSEGQWRKRHTGLGRLATRSVHQGRLLNLIDGLSPQDARGMTWWLAPKVAGPGGVQDFVAFLRTMAGRARLSAPQDALLRDMLKARRSDGDLPMLYSRLREELGKDPGVRSSPLGGYVLALLHDPDLERTTVRLLLQSSYDAGGRASGLLEDLARSGTEVQDLPPLTRRLIAAVRGPNPEALRQFLEEDEADPEQLAEATARLYGRTRWAESFAIEASADLVQEVYQCDAGHDEGLVARLAWEPGGDRDRPSAWALGTLLDRLPMAEATALRPLLAQWNRDKSPDCLLLRDDHRFSHPLAVDCVHRSPDPIARARDFAQRHPIDLRWVALEDEVAKSPTPRLAADGIEAVLAAHSTRNALRVRKAVRRDNELARGLVERYLELRARDPVAQVLAALEKDPYPRRGKTLLAPVPYAIAPRCRTMEDFSALAGFAHRSGQVGLSALLDVVLRHSVDPAVRYGVYKRDRDRSLGVMPVEETRRWALSCGGLTGSIWTDVARDAQVDRRPDLLIEALERIWADMPLEPRFTNGSASSLDFEVRWDEAVSEEASRRVRSGDPTMGLFVYAMPPTNQPELREHALRVRRGLGLALWDSWLWATQTRAEGETLAALRDLGMEDRDEFFVGNLIQTLLHRKRVEEAVSLATEWARRRGPVRCERGKAHDIDHDFFLFDAPAPPQDSRAHVVPREVQAALVLRQGVVEKRVDARHKEVVRLLRTVVENEKDPVIVEAGLLSLSEFLLKRGRLADAAPMLLRIRRESPVVEARRWAHDQLATIYEREPSVRGLFIDEFLAQHPGGEEPDPSEVASWVRRFGAEDPAERALASEALRASGPLAVPLLRSLRALQDPEVRGRAEEVLEELAAP